MNPADLLTKYLTAEIIKKHLGTINASPMAGRAESAPHIDSIEDDDDNSHVRAWVRSMVERRVHFAETVEIRPIPAIGAGRSY